MSQIDISKNKENGMNVIDSNNLNGESVKTVKNQAINIKATEENVEFLRNKFQEFLSQSLNLVRASAPLYVETSSGLNDDLNYVESPVAFELSSGQTCSIVHSLAKWKRATLGKYLQFSKSQGKDAEIHGLWTDMNAIRKDEDVNTIIKTRMHSYYVDQWDWEMIIKKEERNIECLKAVVRKIYQVILHAQREVFEMISSISRVNQLPNEIFFISTQELEDLYPEKTPHEREQIIAKEKKAVFIIGIGHKLKRSQSPHDLRSGDYDDWNLNGDIIVFNNVLGKAMELSSMGIRVDEHSLVQQLQLLNKMEKLQFQYHQDIVAAKLPYTIGGGIGQSRLCMFLLEKRHIGEVQCSVWPNELIEELEKENIFVL